MLVIKILGLKILAIWLRIQKLYAYWEFYEKTPMFITITTASQKNNSALL